jgi:hypothetical protein
VSVHGWPTDSRRWCWKRPLDENTVPGLNEIECGIARFSSSMASTAGGSVSHSSRPPAGRVTSHWRGKCRSMALR